MYKGRPKIWIIFLVVCLISQLLITSMPAIVETVKQAQAEAELRRQEQERLEAEKEQQQATQTPEETTGSEAVEEQSDKERLSEGFGQIVSIIASMSQYLGILIVIYAVFQVVLAFRFEDAEMTSRAISMMVVGGALIGFSTLAPMLFGGLSG